MNKLIELADRVEAATGYDDQLWLDIAFALGWTQHTDEDDPVYAHEISKWWAEPGTTDWSTCVYPPAWLTSLDAAMTLAGSEAVSVLLDAIDNCREDTVSDWVRALPRFVTAASLRAKSKELQEGEEG